MIGYHLVLQNEEKVYLVSGGQSPTTRVADQDSLNGEWS